MYNKVFKRYISYNVPFHQKVLRFNYDVPLDSVIKAVKIILLSVSSGEIFVCRDNLEYSTETLDFAEKLQKQELLHRIENNIWEFKAENSMVKTAFFDKEITFYLRLFIDDKGNKSHNEEYSGNIMLFTSDSAIFPICEKISKEISAHILLDGAKNYLDEISFY